LSFLHFHPILIFASKAGGHLGRTASGASFYD